MVKVRTSTAIGLVHQQTRAPLVWACTSRKSPKKPGKAQKSPKGRKPKKPCPILRKVASQVHRKSYQTAEKGSKSEQKPERGGGDANLGVPLRWRRSMRLSPKATTLTSAWPGPGVGRGVSGLMKRAEAGPLPPRISTAFMNLDIASVRNSSCSVVWGMFSMLACFNKEG